MFQYFKITDKKILREKIVVLSDTPVMESEREKIMRPIQYISRKPADVKLRMRKCALYNENGKKVDLYDAWSKSTKSQACTRRWGV